jgi:endonuclease/exonuclease/phosphatase (EEP) superfamily protein YafD
MRTTTAVTLSMTALVPTRCPLSSVDPWWVRRWDFPRLQLAVLYRPGPGLLGMAAGKRWGRLGLAAVLALALLCQLTWIVPYLPLASVQMRRATRADAMASVRIFTANVLMTNRAADRLRALIEHAEPDVLILTEPDAWWADQLWVLEQTFLYRTSHSPSRCNSEITASEIDRSGQVWVSRRLRERVAVDGEIPIIGLYDQLESLSSEEWKA